jgi:hypothetical protein
MSFVHKVTRSWARGGDALSITESIVVEQEVNMDFQVANAVTDGLHALTLDVSQMKTMYLYSDRAVTLQTNDGTTPDATVTLAAGIPNVWSSTSGATNPFGSTDVTELYITNASGAAANIKIRIGVDPTV